MLSVMAYYTAQIKRRVVVWPALRLLGLGVLVAPICLRRACHVEAWEKPSSTLRPDVSPVGWVLGAADDGLDVPRAGRMAG